MDRYLMSLLGLMCIVLGWSFREIWVRPAWRMWLIPLSFVAFSLPLLLEHRGEVFRFDQDINYRDILSVQQDASSFLESEVPDGEVFYANFPLYSGFGDTRYGFVSNSEKMNPTVVYHDSLRYVAHMYPGVEWAGPKLEPAQKIAHFEKGYAHVSIYFFASTSEDSLSSNSDISASLTNSDR